MRSFSRPGIDVDARSPRQSARHHRHGLLCRSRQVTITHGFAFTTEEPCGQPATDIAWKRNRGLGPTKIDRSRGNSSGLSGPRFGSSGSGGAGICPLRDGSSASAHRRLPAGSPPASPPPDPSPTPRPRFLIRHWAASARNRRPCLRKSGRAERPSRPGNSVELNDLRFPARIARGLARIARHFLRRDHDVVHRPISEKQQAKANAAVGTMPRSSALVLPDFALSSSSIQCHWRLASRFFRSART